MLQPRLIRQSRAPDYVGMSEPEFNKKVRPYLTLIKEPGEKSRAISYDRLEIDAWVDQYKLANGKPGEKMEKKEWQNQHRALEKEVEFGILKKQSAASGFSKAATAVISQRRSGSLRK